MKLIFVTFFCFTFFLNSVIEINCNLHHSNAFVQKVFDILHGGPEKPQRSKERLEIPIKWIVQKLDNFNESDTRTWKMRYMENGNYFKNGGPIFIFVGGEWTISDNFITSGHMVDIAKNHSGYMFYTEHRFYGESIPTKDLSVENLEYLTVHQSLADLAHFIKTVKQTYKGLKDSKVILVGGSYSATMVTWFQRLYPGIAAGSWASSAPLFAKVDFIEYKEVVGYSIISIGGQKCYDNIFNAFHQLENLLNKNKTKVMKLFNICDNFDVKNTLDVGTFLGTISDLFSGLVQTHNSGDIEGACKKIVSKDDSIEGILQYLSKFLTETKCNDFTYKESIKLYNDIKPETASMMRQWTYQTCSYFGWYQTSGSQKQPFGSKFPVELYTKLCKDVFGERFSNATIYENILKTNQNFGGWNPNVTNVIWTHGKLDPWHSMGIQDYNGESFVVPGYAHCKDFSSISIKDTKEMKNSKLRVQKTIENWLKL